MEDVKYDFSVRQIQEIVVAIKVGSGPGNAARLAVIDKIDAAAKKDLKAKTLSVSLSRADLRAIKIGVISAWDSLSTEGCLMVRNACKSLRIWTKGVEPNLPKLNDEKSDEIEDLVDEDGVVELDQEPVE